MSGREDVGDKRKPIVQGGPTGSPISEDVFMPVHMSYALEKEVDTIVNGVMTYSAWEASYSKKPLRSPCSKDRNKTD